MALPERCATTRGESGVGRFAGALLPVGDDTVKCTSQTPCGTGSSGWNCSRQACSLAGPGQIEAP